MLPAYEQAGRTINLDLEEGLIVARGGRRLRQALRNLLENAIRHGRGAVGIRLKQVDDRTAALKVVDNGPPIGREAGELLFERFHKGIQSSAGSGLGLAIVSRTLRNLGGEAQIMDGHCFTVRLTIPCSRSPS